MNVFNRVVMVLLILALMVSATAVLLFPDYFILQLTWLADQLDRAREGLTLTWRLILIGIAVVADLILLFLLVFELRRGKPKAVRVQAVEGGEAAVSVDSIQNRLAYYIDSLSEVISARPRVEIKGDRVRVAVDVKTAATVSVQAKAREVVEVIRMVITETMGLKLLGEPRVNIRTGSYDDVAAPPSLTVAEPALAVLEPPQPEAPPWEEPLVEAPPAEELPAEAEAPAEWEAPAEEVSPTEGV